MPHQQGHLEEEPGYNWSIDESDKGSNWNLSNAVEVAAPGGGNIQTSPLANFLGGVQTGVATMLQAPFDVGRALHQMISGGDVASWLPNYDEDNPTAGANLFSDLFQKAGEWEEDFFANSIFSGGILDFDRLYDPDSYGHQIGKEAAYNLASLVPVFAAAGRGPNIARRLELLGREGGAEKFTYEMFQPMLSYVRNAPLKATLIDLGLSFPMGVGAKFGRDVAGQTGEDIGRLAGIATPVSLSLAAPLTRRAATSIGDVFGWTQASKERVVQDALEGVLSPAQLRMLQSGDFETPVVGGPFTTAEVLDAGGAGKLRAETLRRTTTDDTALKADQAREENLLRELEVYRPDLSPGAAGDAERASVALMQKRIADTLSSIDTQSKKAIDRAQGRIDRLNSDEPVETSAVIVRDELDKAYQAAKVKKDALWTNIGDGTFRTDNIIAQAKRIIAESARLSGPKGQPAIPEVILEIAGRDAAGNARPSILRDVETIKEISALSKRINSLARESTNLDEKRLLGKIRDSLYDNLIPVSGDGTEALAKARAFSKYFASTFYEGGVGDVLGYSKNTVTKVDPIVTLNQFVKPGLEGKSLVNGLREAAKSTPGGLETVDQRVQNQLVNSFFLNVMKRSARGVVTFNIGSAENFVTRHPILDLYPDLKAAMLDSSSAQRLINWVDKTSANRLLAVKEMSAASKYLDGGDPSIAISQILRDKRGNPVQRIKQLILMASKDPTGQALKGVKSAFYNSLIDNMTIQSPTGRTVLSYNKAKKYVTNTTNRSIIRNIYGNDGLKLLDSVLKGMQYQNRGKMFPPSMLGGDQYQPMSRELAGNMGTILGARALGGLIGSPLLAAGTGKRNVLRIFDKLKNQPMNDIYVMIQRAMDDPEYAKLMTKPINRLTNGDTLNIIDFIARAGLIAQPLSIDSLIEPLQ